MLLVGWEVRIVKNCDRGLENAARGRSISEVTVFHYTDLSQTTFSTFANSREKTHASVTVTVVRDRKIRTALRTNQIAEFVTVTAWKKIIHNTSTQWNMTPPCPQVRIAGTLLFWLLYG